MLRSHHISVRLASSIAISIASCALATTYTDAIGDNYGGAYVDIASVVVTNDATHVTFQINLNPSADLLAGDGSQIYGKYMIGFSTGTPGSTTLQGAWGQPIGISTGTGMDYWLGSWADNSATPPFAGGAQVYDWNGESFVLTAGIGTNEPYIEVPVTLASTSTTISIPLASLGLSAGNTFGFDVWTTFSGTQSAYDALGKPTQTTAPGVPWEGTPYDSGTAGPGGTSSLLPYTVAGVATNSSWNVDADGNWTVSGNWSAGVPNGVDHVANFGSAIASPRTITLDASQTVGAVNFDSASGYTITSAANSLTLDVSTGPAAINVVNGSHVVSAGVTLADDLNVSIATGSSLAVTGTLTATGRAITKSGAGTVQFENVRSASVAVNEGVVRISTKAANHSSSGTSSLDSLAIASGAVLDLGNNSLVLGYAGSGSTQLDVIRGHLASGRLTGAPATPNASLVVGYADNAALNRTNFDGLTVGTNSILIGLTLKGDTNLDRTVNFDDLLALAQAYGMATGATWQKGDIDYNGAVNFDDLLALAQVYGGSAMVNGEIAIDAAADFAADWTRARSLVPEPSLLSAAVGFSLVRRRRA